MLIRPKKAGEERKKQAKKGTDAKQNIHNETKRQREGSKKKYVKKEVVTGGATGSVTGGAGVTGDAGVTGGAGESFTVDVKVTGAAGGSLASSPPKRRARHPRKNTLLFQRIGSKQDRGPLSGVNKIDGV